jgi:tetratricopeptide (TPR) repeat protein
MAAVSTPVLAAPPAPPAAPAAPAAKPAAVHDLVAKGQALFEDQRYEESIQTLSAALLASSNSEAQKIEIYRILALDYITLARKDEAESAVRALLVIAPDYALPADESPRFRDFFARARTAWEAEGRPGIVTDKPRPLPVALRHGAPSQVEAGQTVEFRARLDDPGGRTASVRLLYRIGVQGDFAEVTAEIAGESVRAQVLGSAVKPPILDYYFEIIDRDGQLIATRGDPSSPLRLVVPEARSRWVLPVAIGGGVLGAAAILGGLALAGVFKSGGGAGNGATPGRSTVTVNVGESSFGH